MLLPIRSRVLHYMSKVEKADAYQVMEGLRDEYGEERQFTRENFIDHLLSLKANGLLDELSYDINNKGELQIFYKINEDGKNTVVKYLPKKYQG